MPAKVFCHFFSIFSLRIYRSFRSCYLSVFKRLHVPSQLLFFKEKMQKFISVIEESGVSLSEPDVYVALENQGRAQDYRLSLAFPFSITPCET